MSHPVDEEEFLELLKKGMKEAMVIPKIREMDHVDLIVTHYQAVGTLIIEVL